MAGPTSAASQTPGPPSERPATPPASAADIIPASTVVIAAAVLILALVLLQIARRGEGRRDPADIRPQTAPESATDVLMLLTSAGEALIDSGFDVNDVQSDLVQIARAYGMADAEIIALPTALLVSSRTGGQLRTAAVASGRQRLRLHQIEELEEVVRAARAGRVEPRTGHDRIVEIRARPAPFGPLSRVAGQVLATVGLTVLLGSSWIGIAVSAGLGGLTGALQAAGCPSRPASRSCSPSPPRSASPSWSSCCGGAASRPTSPQV